VYQPGAKADCCLILEGEQGAGKSTAISILAGEWFTDQLPDLHTKDAAMQCNGVWIIEIGELNTFSRSEVGAIKAFMSRTTDRFRPPFGKGVIEAPRQCIFAGSVNHGEYLRDETGARRFWPVWCGGPFDIAGLERDRDQIWAEAVARYREGAKRWIEGKQLLKETEEQQQERYEVDAWQDIIQQWVANPTQSPLYPQEPLDSWHNHVTIPDILTHCIGKRRDSWTQVDQNRIARILRAINWKKHRENSPPRVRYYAPKELSHS